jgi:hypothetical protein
MPQSLATLRPGAPDLLMVRRIGFSILAILAVAVWLTLGPSRTKPVSQYQRAIEAAKSAYETNSTAADSAPQQSVVIGWFGHDMQVIVAEQNNDLLRSANDPRVPALLLLGILGLCLHGLTLPAPTGGDRQGAMAWSEPVRPPLAPPRASSSPGPPPR